MPAVSRLETFVDIDGDAGVGRRMSVSARHEAVLEDGHRLLLLDGRGWSAELRGWPPDASPDIWALTSMQEIVDTARMVVGPDEPHSQTARITIRRHDIGATSSMYFADTALLQMPWHCSAYRTTSFSATRCAGAYGKTKTAAVITNARFSSPTPLTSAADPAWPLRADPASPQAAVNPQRGPSARPERSCSLLRRGPSRR
jgi:hypothetical protein